MTLWSNRRLLYTYQREKQLGLSKTYWLPTPTSWYRKKDRLRYWTIFIIVSGFLHMSKSGYFDNHWVACTFYWTWISSQSQLINELHGLGLGFLAYSDWLLNFTYQFIYFKFGMAHYISIIMYCSFITLLYKWYACFWPKTMNSLSLSYNFVVSWDVFM